MYGGGYNIAPEASLTDGYFDVYFVDKVNKPVIPFLINMLKKGTHGNHKKVHRNKATKVSFKCDYDLVCNIDGEIIKDTNFDFSIIENGLILDIDNSKVINDFLKVKKIIK